MHTKEKIFEIFHQLNPEPKIELDYHNAYTFLVAIILSAQTTDKLVNRVTKSLFQEVQTPEAMCQLGQEKLEKKIQHIGLYRNKARNVIKTSEILIQQYDGVVPEHYAALIELPGVGRKTANVFLNGWLNEPCVAVDRHVYRVSRRIGLAAETTLHGVEEELMANVPEQWLKHAHKWLVLHGRYLCLARKPKCACCPIQDYCDFYHGQSA